MSIDQPQAINHIGGRSNNEDSVYPLLEQLSEKDNLFLVCDGVGGNEKGEIASRMVCDEIAAYFGSNPTAVSDEAYIVAALRKAEEAMEIFVEENPLSEGMATTLTLAHLHENGVTVAHVGDSRVYQFRGDDIEFKTKDHSHVNDLLDAGIITPEEAENHPKKNVITRAVQGVGKPAKPDVYQLTDIQAGDYFFLCTDGILENLSDFEIQQILKREVSDKEKMGLIQQRCEENPNDNFSAILFRIKEGLGVGKDIPGIKSEETPTDEQEVVEAELVSDADVVEAQLDEERHYNDDGKVEKTPGKLNKRQFLWITLVIIGVVMVVYMRFARDNSNAVQKEPVDSLKVEGVEAANISEGEPDQSEQSKPVEQKETDNQGEGKE